MTPAELESIGSRVFGHGWQTKLAAHLEVADRTVRRWVAGHQIPEGVGEQIRDLIRIAAPVADTAEADRDRACRRALFPHYDTFAKQAMAAGWDVAEILAASISWAAQRTCDIAGHAAARDLLNQAIHETEADERNER